MAFTRYGWNCRTKNKFNAKKTMARDGHRVYDSRLEARDAEILANLEREGTISRLQEQVRYRIFVNGQHITDSIVDFQFVHNGTTVWYETKGLETDRYKVVKKLILATIPPHEKYIVNTTDLKNYLRGRLTKP